MVVLITVLRYRVLCDIEIKIMVGLSVLTAVVVMANFISHGGRKAACRNVKILLPQSHDAMQSAVVPRFVVCLSVSDCLSVHDDQVPRSHTVGSHSSKIILRPNGLRVMRGLTPTVQHGRAGATGTPYKLGEMGPLWGWGQSLNRKLVISPKRCEIGVEPRLL